MLDSSAVLWELVADRDEVIAELRSHNGALSSQAQHLRSEIGRLSGEAARLAAALEAEARGVRLLREENARVTAHNEHIAAQTRRLEEQLNANQAAFVSAARDGEKLELELRGALRELDARLAETRAEADARVAAAELERTQILERFTRQTDELVAQTNDQIRTVAHLIDIVQSSKFWALKRGLRRLGGARS